MEVVSSGSQFKKGIILAGGHGTRMYPNTTVVNKQLLPVYDKPMIYYPLSTLMLADIRHIAIISSEYCLPLYKKLLGDGSSWGIQLEYIIQRHPDGIAHAFILAEEFINNDPVCLILGDNIIYGDSLPNLLRHSISSNKGAVIFSYPVTNPENYGVVILDHNNQPVDLIEKPNTDVSNNAIIGLYFYDSEVVNIAKSIKPSARNELEITDINRLYLKKNQLTVTCLSRGVAWLDTGTPNNLLEASNYVSIMEKRLGLKIYCPEEVAWRMQFISDSQFLSIIKKLKRSQYQAYLQKLYNQPIRAIQQKAVENDKISL